jgi:hypothetical protein
MPIIAMIDPAAGIWGTLFFFSTFGVGSLALIAHIVSRRYFLINFAIAGVFTIFVFGFWIYMTIQSSHGYSPGFRYVLMSAWWSLLTSFLVGLPFEVCRCWRSNRDEDKRV